MEDFTIIPCAKVYPSKIVVYDRIDYRGAKRKQSARSLLNLSRGEYNGELSIKSKSKIKGMLDIWLGGVESKVREKGGQKYFRNQLVTFITLTLPAKQFHSDNQIKRSALVPFIQKMIVIQGVSCYFWRAESQKNGNIHFHLLVNKFIAWEWIRQEWNAYMDRMGYISRYRMAMSRMSESAYVKSRKCKSKEDVTNAIKSYRKGVESGWNDPNSTDIHGLEKVHSTSAYICKYVSKSSKFRKIEGRIWGCSDNLRMLKGYEVLRDQKVSEVLQEMHKSEAVKIFEGENFSVLTGNVRRFFQKVCKGLSSELDRYLSWSWQVVNSSIEGNAYALSPFTSS